MLDQTGIVRLPIVDFPPDHERAPDLLRMLGKQELLRIPRDPKGPAGACYWIARDAAEHFNGFLALGWMIRVLPDVYIEAMHHGVLRLANGNYVDVTAPQDGPLGRAWTTFVPDESISFDPAWPMQVESRHLVLVDDPEVEVSLALYRENNALMAAYWRRAREDGRYSWSPNMGLMGPGPVAVPGSEATRLRESFSEMHAIRARLKARYCS